MPFVLPDRTRETLASAPGTGNVTTAGATQGAQSIASKLTSNGDTTWATIDNGTAWETNTITRVSAGVYSRGTPFESSNSGSLVDFSSGTLEIFIDIPASKAKVLERLAWAAAAITPPTNDGTALGTGSLAFSDLFLASGGVLNFNNGNYTITHSAGQLTFSGIVAAASKLFIGASAAFSNGQGELTFDGNSVRGLLFKDTHSSAGTNTVINFNRNGSDVGSIQETLAATVYNTSSDETTKMMFDEDGIDWGERIDRLWVGAYQAIVDPGQWRLGIRGQQAYGIVPQGVTRPKTIEHVVKNENGDDVVIKEQTGYQVDYSLALGPLAMWGVKNLRKRVADMEQEIAALKKRLGK